MKKNAKSDEDSTLSTLSIHYALDTSYLGIVLIAITVRGVCMVSLGDDGQVLELALQDRFGGARIDRVDSDYAPIIAQVMDHIAQPTAKLDIPIDLHGTAFQRRVWQALLTIPVGATASYTEIAERIGAPQAVRAVAGACAANPLAVLIPCHRVLRRDGSLSGYYWGIERKAKLLHHEQTM